jgi:hypothetical protein
MFTISKYYSTPAAVDCKPICPSPGKKTGLHGPAFTFSLEVSSIRRLAKTKPKPYRPVFLYMTKGQL